MGASFVWSLLALPPPGEAAATAGFTLAMGVVWRLWAYTAEYSFSESQMEAMRHAAQFSLWKKDYTPKFVGPLGLWSAKYVAKPISWAMIAGGAAVLLLAAVEALIR